MCKIIDFLHKTAKNREVEAVYALKTGLQVNKRSHSGDNGVEDPPVPIPNTEVKLYCAEST